MIITIKLIMIRNFLKTEIQTHLFLYPPPLENALYIEGIHCIFCRISDAIAKPEACHPTTTERQTAGVRWKEFLQLQFVYTQIYRVCTNEGTHEHTCK
jgi:hypothetical protein